MTTRDPIKDDLRAGFLAARRARSAADLATARDRVREHVLALSDELGPRCVAAYEPLNTEPGSVELLSALAARRIRVLVPHTLPDRDLDWQAWSPGGVGALLGLEAIGAAELIVVPALAVASDGTRLGRGRGCYDRTLPRRTPGAQVWALLFDDELVETLPGEQWDVPVDGVVRPSGRVRLPRNTGTVRAG